MFRLIQTGLHLREMAIRAPEWSGGPARGGACAVVEVPFVSCERFLALGQRRAGTERVNPLPDAVPSSRPLRLARARAALWDAVGRRARSRWGARRLPSP